MPGSLDQDFQIVAHFVLAIELIQTFDAQGRVQAVRRLGVGINGAFGHEKKGGRMVLIVVGAAIDRYYSRSFVL
jgi:hypothetical protein